MGASNCRYSGSESRPNRTRCTCGLHKKMSTFHAFANGDVGGAATHLVVGGDLGLFQNSQNVQGGQDMFSGQGLFIEVGSDHFGNVIDAVPGGVGIFLKCVEFFVFGHLGDKAFERVFVFGFIF